MECKHQYTQWKGQIETCLFCNIIVNLKDMMKEVKLPEMEVKNDVR